MAIGLRPRHPRQRNTNSSPCVIRFSSYLIIYYAFSPLAFMFFVDIPFVLAVGTLVTLVRRIS